MFNYLIYMYMNILNIFLTLVMVLVGIAFLTLLERKILGYIQFRKGPNKVGFLGIFQPFSDAIKLFNKELLIIYKSNYILYYLCPILSFMLMLMVWLNIPQQTHLFYMWYSMLSMILILSVASYIIIYMGWSSNSVYSMLGSLRSVAQVLSYEVSLILIMMIFMILSESYSFLEVMKWQNFMWNMIFMFPVFIVFLFSVLAELNRSPMDFIEGESELVSGFNIEYFSGGFALIFLAEYGMIVFFSLIIVLMFIKISVNSMSFCIMIYLNVFCVLIISIRGLLPRMRYDELMYLCWKIILPMILSYLLFIMGFKFLMSLLI